MIQLLCSGASEAGDKGSDLGCRRKMAFLIGFKAKSGMKYFETSGV